MVHINLFLHSLCRFNRFCAYMCCKFVSRSSPSFGFDFEQGKTQRNAFLCACPRCVAILNVGKHRVLGQAVKGGCDVPVLKLPPNEGQHRVFFFLCVVPRCSNAENQFSAVSLVGFRTFLCVEN